MQIRGAASPGIFNFQPSTVSPIRPNQIAAASGISDSEGVDEVAARLPDPQFDQTFDEATKITTALIAALNSGEQVGMVLQEIV